MARASKIHVKKLVEELLMLQPLVERYKDLDREVKSQLLELEMTEVEIKGKGRVFISISERVTIAPDLAREILAALADKVIQIKESVSNSLINALVKTGDISAEAEAQLLERADRKQVVNLYVRPLK